MASNIVRYAAIATSIAICFRDVHADVPALSPPPEASTPVEPSIFGERTDVTVGIGLNYAARYLGAAKVANSPVVTKRTSSTASAAIAYTF